MGETFGMALSGLERFDGARTVPRADVSVASVGVVEGVKTVYEQHRRLVPKAKAWETCYPLNAPRPPTRRRGRPRT